MGPALKSSSLAAPAGWCTGMLYCCVAILWSFGFDRGIFFILFWIGLFFGAVIWWIWLIALLPLALIVPNQSFLWNKCVLAPMGFFSGLSIATVVVLWNALRNESDWPPDMYDWHINFMNNLGSFGPPAAIVGLVTCLAGAFLHRRE
jgi:hypothetical protein